MEKNHLVTIIINNFNYGRFLDAAIESALSQTYAPIEVIVVDDGSTDDSREVIARYGERVVPILKENGGQASAFNAGFKHSHGSIVIFLDADDVLFPHIAGSVVKEFVKDPTLAKVQYPLDVIDADGHPTGERVPPASLSMPRGDLRKHMLSFPDDVRSSPTSGNAFASSMLRQILPMPEARPRFAWADLYLYNLAPLFGSVQSLPSPGGLYRRHETNHYYSSTLDLGRIRQMMVSTRDNKQYILQYARMLKLADIPQRAEDMLSVTYIVNRIASYRLDPLTHPFKADSRLRLTRLGVRASRRRFDIPLRVRMIYMTWFVAAAFAPKPLVTWLVTQVFYPQRRGVLARFV